MAVVQISVLQCDRCAATLLTADVAESGGVEFTAHTSTGNHSLFVCADCAQLPLATLLAGEADAPESTPDPEPESEPAKPKPARSRRKAAEPTEPVVEPPSESAPAEPETPGAGTDPVVVVNPAQVQDGPPPGPTFIPQPAPPAPYGVISADDDF